MCNPFPFPPFLLSISHTSPVLRLSSSSSLSRPPFPVSSPRQLQNPTSMKPPFKFATTLHGNTDVLMKKSFPVMHAYMRQFNQSSPVEGVKAVKKG